MSSHSRRSAPADPGKYSRFRIQMRDLPAVLLRFALFTLLWWILAEGRWQEPLVIALIVVLSTLSSLFLWPLRSWRWRPLHVLAFLPWFLWQSLRGGFDVSRRAFQVRPALRPEFSSMTIHLPSCPSCLFAWIISLLPGTACISREGEDFVIHLLDSDSLPQVKILERRIHRLLRVS